MTILFHDFETFNKLDVTEVGTAKYARDPSCKPLMCAYAFDDGEVAQWVPAEGQLMPAELKEAIEDPYVVKSAWNKPFEWNIWTHSLQMRTPHNCWRDSMVMALSCSFPGSLSAASRIMGLPADKAKMAEGKRLIRLFCNYVKPTKQHPYHRRTSITDPEKWELFKQYNRQDVEAERAIYNKLKPYDLPPHEWALWFLDQEINERGLPINMNVVSNAMATAEYVFEDRMQKMRDITGLSNPNSGPQLLPWLQDQGYPFDDLKKGHIERALNKIVDACEDEVDYIENKHYIDVLTMRSETAKASVKKYNALDRAVTEDGLLRNSLQFCAAGRTWRWGGRIYQPQNLARPAPYLEKSLETDVAALELLTPWEIEQVYKWPMDLLSSCVRPVVQAPEGYVLLDCDLNAIENRMLGWMAHDEKILEVFASGRDPYVDFATYMYKQPYDKLWAEYKAGDKAKRTTAKPAVLGCGYQLGPGAQFENEQTGELEATGLLGYAWNMYVRLTPEEAKLSVEVWRATFKAAVEYWREIERAAKTCVRTGRKTSAGPVDFVMDGAFLKMRLPSGRFLHYKDPRVLDRKTHWGAVNPTLTYMNLDLRNQWVRTNTHGGKLTENADQAMSRDVLANGIRLGMRRNIDIRLHVHDQIVALAPEDKAEAQLAILKECMLERQKWSETLPLGVAGGISKVFLKD